MSRLPLVVLGVLASHGRGLVGSGVTGKYY